MLSRQNDTLCYKQNAARERGFRSLLTRPSHANIIFGHPDLTVGVLSALKIQMNKFEAPSLRLPSAANSSPRSASSEDRALPLQLPCCGVTAYHL
jgi:hypothetical protein